MGNEKYWLKLGLFNENLGATRSIHGTGNYLPTGVISFHLFFFSSSVLSFVTVSIFNN